MLEVGYHPQVKPDFVVRIDNRTADGIVSCRGLDSGSWAVQPGLCKMTVLTRDLNDAIENRPDMVERVLLGTETAPTAGYC